MTENLKPCPFCGGDATLRKNEYSDGYYVTCLSKTCSVLVVTCQRKTEEEAAEIWNRRANNDESESNLMEG